MKNTTLTLAFMAAFAFGTKAQTFSYDFTTGYQGWSGDFADYPLTDSVFYELEITRTTLPAPLSTTKYALKVSGNNHSDDLFMFIKHKITGLMPNTTYTVFIDIEVASSAPTNHFGVGGAPGESVWFKAGASVTEPLKQVDGTYYRMNIDKGSQALGGADMDTIGHVGVSDTTTQFTLIQRSNAGHPFTVTTDVNGEVWVCIGTDSGYEATTTLYYNQLDFVFTAVLGVDDERGTTDLMVYPNPSSGKISIEGMDENSTVEITDEYGQKMNVSVLGFGSKAIADLSLLPAGIYFVKAGTNRVTKIIHTR